MKRGFLSPSKKEPAGLCTIRKSTRDVSIDTLQATSIDSVNQASKDTIHQVSKNTVHDGTVHPVTVHDGTVHPVTVPDGTVYPVTVHRGTVHRDTVHPPSTDTVHLVSTDSVHPPSTDTVHLVSTDTVHPPSTDTVHPVSIDTVHPSTVHPNTVHRNTVHQSTVHPSTVHGNTVHPSTVHGNTVHPDTVFRMSNNVTIMETEHEEEHIFKIDKKGIWRDKGGRPRSSTGKLINADGCIIPDVIAVAELNTFALNSQLYDRGSENRFKGLPHEDPRNHIEELEGLVSRRKQKKISDDLILCKIFPYTISGAAFKWFSQLQPRSLTSWDDIERAFLYQFLDAAEATREKEKNDKWDTFLASLGDKIMIPIHLLNDFIATSDVHHGFGEPSKVEEADTRDPTSASIDSTMSKSIDTGTSETTEIDLSHQSIPLKIPDATAVNPGIERQRALRDFDKPEDLYAKSSALRCSTSQSPIPELHPAYISLVSQNPCEAAANLEVEMRSMLEYMVEENEQHESGEPSIIEEVETSDQTSAPIDTTTTPSIDDNTSTSNDVNTSASVDTHLCHRSIPHGIPERSSFPHDIAGSTQKITDVPSCPISSDVEKEITMEDFLELEEFLELEDEQQLGDLDSNKEVTMEDFLEQEEWLEDMDQNLEQKLGGEQNTSGGYLETPPKDIIDRHQPVEIDRHPPNDIDRQPMMDELPEHTVEMEPVKKIMHRSETSHFDVPKHQRPLICAEEAVGIHKKVKRVHDPVKIMVPYAVLEAESPIPPDRGMLLSSYTGVLDDYQYVEASQRGLRYRSELDSPSTPVSNDISQPESIDTSSFVSIDTTTSPSVDTRRVSEQIEYKACKNLFDGDTTTRSDKSGGKKRRNWKKRKRIKEDPQLSLIPHFSDGVRKPRVRSRCFSQPFAKLRALLIAEMIDKGDESIEEAFTQE